MTIMMGQSWALLDAATWLRRSTRAQRCGRIGDDGRGAAGIQVWGTDRPAAAVAHS
jgi:hypothetical protein